MTRQEFANLLEKEGSTIYSFCCYLTGNRDKADDLYQETMLVAIEKCGKIDKTENPKNRYCCKELEKLEKKICT